MDRKLIEVTGVVQGVGFRPFIYGLADEYNLRGYIVNTSRGVEIDVEGPAAAIERFIAGIREKAPPLAVIDDIAWQRLPAVGYSTFEIKESVEDPDRLVPVAPDTATCPECRRELLDPGDRRNRYPFINCTNCGPRFTIITGVPYDRPKTTMREFTMCPDCSAEYRDPADRRFHAQPNACPVCGPRLMITDREGHELSVHDPVKKAREALADGKIIAVKGLGGYHLACDALNEEAVRRLRDKKIREDKPFAVMVKDLATVRQYCLVDEKEGELLAGGCRPIVVLQKRTDCPVAPSVTPGNSFLGVMLPYTPLHILLLDDGPAALVMTSGNVSDEPIAYRDEDAFARLGGIADLFLTHDREIRHRCDDSVTRVFRGEEYIMRRARGYAPAPLLLAREMGQILALGGEQKNTFCLTKDRYAFVSHHIGDLENMETLASFEEGIDLYKKLFGIKPEIIVHDLHPEYLSTKYAMAQEGLPLAGVQHHHAHVAACMAENRLNEKVIGVSFDGTGYGTDGHIWGGEFLVSDYLDFRRAGRLAYVPMPGGTKAVREPWRMAVGYLNRTFGPDWHEVCRWPAGIEESKVSFIQAMVEKGINTPLTSSMGRLFDAVSALLGIRLAANYEGQGAVELEQEALRAVNGAVAPYDIDIDEEAGIYVVNISITLRQIIDDLSRGIPVSDIAGRFHATVTEIIFRMCLLIRRDEGLKKVCLTGGVFQNMLLLGMTFDKLRENEFDVYVHSKIPVNDGGISLGQAVIAAERRRNLCV
ncbi:MAG: carbamoyltransferase HypF [Bacillota bacterium]